MGLNWPGHPISCFFIALALVSASGLLGTARLPRGRAGLCNAKAVSLYILGHKWNRDLDGAYPEMPPWSLQKIQVGIRFPRPNWQPSVGKSDSKESLEVTRGHMTTPGQGLRVAQDRCRKKKGWIRIKEWKSTSVVFPTWQSWTACDLGSNA